MSCLTYRRLLPCIVKSSCCNAERRLTHPSLNNVNYPVWKPRTPREKEVGATFSESGEAVDAGRFLRFGSAGVLVDCARNGNDDPSDC